MSDDVEARKAELRARIKRVDGLISDPQLGHLLDTKALTKSRDRAARELAALENPNAK